MDPPGKQDAAFPWNFMTWLEIDQEWLVAIVTTLQREIFSEIETNSEKSNTM